MDLPHSYACYVRAYPSATAEAWVDGHVHAFAFFGKVPVSVLYDNDRCLVAKILPDGTCQRATLFCGFVSHDLFRDRYGRPGKGNDKGNAEGLVGCSRRNFMVPIPRFASWDVFNGDLEEQCRQRQADVLRGQAETIGERLVRGLAAMADLPAAPFDACDQATGHVSSQALVRYKTNDYSVPVACGHRDVWIRGYVDAVVIGCGGEVIARHPRCHDRKDMVFDPVHYLPLIEQKINALDQAAPLAGWGLPISAARRCRDHLGGQLHDPAFGGCGMTVAPKILLADHLKTPTLPTFLREYDKLARQCAAEGQDHVQFLARLVELGLIDRERRMIKRRIKAAKFPATKSLDSFDFRAVPKLNKMQVLELARCEWIDRRENVIALGPSGTGKTHVALGLGLAACQKGMTVGFTTAAALVNEMMEARDERRLLRIQKQLATVKLLIVDELGFVPLSKTGAELLFELIPQSYERGSTMITSNLPFDEWTETFDTERLTGALLDRLTHHVNILEMNGDSYRLGQSSARKTDAGI